VVASIEFEFLANIRRISELGFNSTRIRFRRIRISVSEIKFEFEFGELYTLFQNSDSPNIREYEFEFELAEFFPTPDGVCSVRSFVKDYNVTDEFQAHSIAIMQRSFPVFPHQLTPITWRLQY
jgi:hypothetical protein